MCKKFDSEEMSTTGDVCYKSDSKQKRWGRALLVVEAIDCQQREVKRSYRGFVIVVIGIIIIVLLLVFFGRVCFFYLFLYCVFLFFM